MKKSTQPRFSRRDLLAKVIPACALTCIAPCHALGASAPGKKIFQGHKFDTEMEGKMTYRQLWQRQYYNIVEFCKGLKKELGDEDAIALIKKLSEKASIEMGKTQAQQMGENSLQAFVKQFKDPEVYKYLLTMEIVEDTDEAFELNITECLWAEAFIAQNAGDIGFAWICFGDYGWPQGFNPELRMVRDKTLMQGNSCCNHRYVYKT